MKLRTKLVVVLLVLAVVLGSGLYGGLELYKGQLVEREHDRATETATAVAAQIDAAVQEKRDFVGFVASRPAASSFDNAGGFARELVDDSRFYAVQIVTADGTVRAFEGDVTAESRNRTVGSDAGDQPYVRTALDGRTYVSDIETTPSGKYLVVISSPIVDGNEVVGVLAAAMYVDTSTLLTPAQPLSSDQRAVAVVSGGETLYAAGPSFDRSISAEATVESTGWTVRVTRDRAALDAVLRGAGIAQALGVAFVLVAVGLTGGWQYRTTVVQMDRLQRAFDAAGRGEYEYDVALSGGNEWNTIAVGFNDLLDDLSERERSLDRRRERLEVLNRVLRHNLRTDVNIILGYAEELRNGSEGATSPADIIYRRANSLAELSDIAQQSQQLMVDGAETHTVVDVAAELRDIVDRVGVAFPAVRFAVDLPTTSCVSAAPQLTTALEHVVENACEHNDAETPFVSVSLEPTGDGRVDISVADNGPGIPSHEIEVLERGEETALDHGSGIGLWLVRWVVDGSDGTLSFEPNDPRGSVVTVRLDMATSPGDD